MNPTNFKIKYLLEVLTESLALEWNIYHLGHTHTSETGTTKLKPLKSGMCHSFSFYRRIIQCKIVFFLQFRGVHVRSNYTKTNHTKSEARVFCNNAFCQTCVKCGFSSCTPFFYYFLVFCRKVLMLKIPDGGFKLGLVIALQQLATARHVLAITMMVITKIVHRHDMSFV